MFRLYEYFRQEVNASMAWDALTDDVGGGDDQQIVPSLVLVKISNNDWNYFSALVKFLIIVIERGGWISNRRYLAQNFSVVHQDIRYASTLILLTRESGVRSVNQNYMNRLVGLIRSFVVVCVIPSVSVSLLTETCKVLHLHKVVVIAFTP